MPHVTRCPNCHTSFRVTDAHLAAYGGKVRCGRCTFVFDARSHFMTHSQPVRESKADPVPVQPLSELPAQETDFIQHETHLSKASTEAQSVADLKTLATLPANDQPNDSPEYIDARDEQLEQKPLAHLHPTDSHANTPPEVHPFDPSAESFKLDLPGFTMMDSAEEDLTVAELSAFSAAEGRIEPSVHFDAEADMQDLLHAHRPFVTNENTDTAETRPSVESSGGALKPDIPAGSGYHPILTAEDEALLRVPKAPSPLRWLWAIPCFIALLTLVGQFAFYYRTDISVQLPGSKPWLDRFCKQLDCRVEMPSRADLLRTDWSELNFLPDQNNLVQLSATVRNLANFEQPLPFIELTLMDDQERIILRKVLRPKEYLTPINDGKTSALPDSMLPGADIHVFVRLDIGAIKSNSYQINLFYPQVH